MKTGLKLNMAVAKLDQKEELKRNEQKWSRTLMKAGWTAVPSIILEKQAAFGLDAIDVNILMHLARHWWYPDNPPHPSKGLIAKCIGVDRSTVRKHIARMESEGLIERVARFNKRLGGQETNIYRFDGLIKAATPHAEEFIDLRAKQRREDAARQNRKKAAKPQLVVDNTTI